MTAEAKNYFIKEGYLHKPRSITAADDREAPYWGRQQIAKARYYQYHVYAYCAQLIRKHGIHSVLDIGCGTAYKLMHQIHPVCHDVSGIDQEHIVEYCKRQYTGATFYADNLEAPTLRTDRFYDLIICSDVIEHLYDPDVLLRYIKSFAVPSSLIVISTPDRDLLGGSNLMTSKSPEHVREWNRTEFSEYLTHSGFDVVEHRLFRFAKATLAPSMLMDNLFARLSNYSPFHCLTVLCRLSERRESGS